jgi:hypothetical protein
MSELCHGGAPSYRRGISDASAATGSLNRIDRRAPAQ